MEDKKYEYLDKIQTMETERLILKKANDEDFKILSKFLMDSEVTKYLNPDCIESFHTSQEAFEYLLGKNKNFIKRSSFVLQLKDSKCYIGLVNFFIVEEFCNEIGRVGLFIGKEFQKKGFAKEALFKILDEVFLSSSNITSFEYIISCYNTTSFFLFSSLFSYLLTMNKNLRLKILQDNLDQDLIKFFVEKI